MGQTPEAHLIFGIHLGMEYSEAEILEVLSKMEGTDREK